MSFMKKVIRAMGKRPARARPTPVVGLLNDDPGGVR